MNPVLTTFAMNAPDANYEPKFMPDSSHFQMRNDRNTEDAVKAIFNEGLEKDLFNINKTST